MDGRQLADGLDLHHHQSLNHYIQAIPGLEVSPPVAHGQWHLSLHTEAACGQLMRQANGVGALEQAGPECSVNVHGSRHDMAGNVVDVHRRDWGDLRHPVVSAKLCSSVIVSSPSRTLACRGVVFRYKSHWCTGKRAVGLLRRVGRRASVPPVLPAVQTSEFRNGLRTTGRTGSRRHSRVSALPQPGYCDHAGSVHLTDPRRNGALATDGDGGIPLTSSGVWNGQR